MGTSYIPLIGIGLTHFLIRSGGPAYNILRDHPFKTLAFFRVKRVKKIATFADGQLPKLMEWLNSEYIVAIKPQRLEILRAIAIKCQFVGFGVDLVFVGEGHIR